MYDLYQQKPRWGLIKINNHDAGVVQILEAGILKKLIHGVIIDRGPLWLDGFGGPEHMQLFVRVLNDHFPARFGRKRRFIPEHNGQDLSYPEFRHKPGSGYETIWINTQTPEDKRRAKLKKNWRYSLRKAEQGDLKLEWDWSGRYWDDMIRQYIRDRTEKGYKGPSVKLLVALARHSLPDKNMLIGWVTHNGQPVGGILIFCHGRAATYQVGWSSQEGRKTGAHNLLLWRALDVLKKRGIDDLDLGGVNSEEAEGVQKFKNGMGGQRVVLPGLYY